MQPQPNMEDAVASYRMFLQWNEEKQTHEAMCDMKFKDEARLVFSIEPGAKIPKIIQGWIDACCEGG